MHGQGLGSNHRSIGLGRILGIFAHISMGAIQNAVHGHAGSNGKAVFSIRHIGFASAIVNLLGRGSTGVRCNLLGFAHVKQLIDGLLVHVDGITTAAYSIIHCLHGVIRLGFGQRNRTGHAHSHNITRVLRFHDDVRSTLDIAQNIGRGIPINMIIGNGGPDARGTLGDAHSATQADIKALVRGLDVHPAVVFDVSILRQLHISATDIGLGAVVKAVHQHGAIDGHTVALAAAGRHGQIHGLVAGFHVNFGRTNFTLQRDSVFHLGTVSDVSLGCIVLVHGKRRTAYGGALALVAPHIA